MNLEEFRLLLINCIPHALVRYGDGERNILNNISCNRKGFRFDAEKDQDFREELIQSYRYNKSCNYYVADNIKMSARVFVNENYIPFLKRIVPLFKQFPIFFICNVRSNRGDLPFVVQNCYRVSDNAWEHNDSLHKFILRDLKDYNSPVLILCAAGPFSNVLIHRIWKETKNHILWNVGSVFDPYLYGRYTRQYQERLDN